MRRILFPLVLVLPLGYPAIAAADLRWVDPAWSVTPSVSGEFPPYGTGSAGSSDPAADSLTGTLSAYAENPPGPGGPSVVSSLVISRSFRVINATTALTLQLAIGGSLSVGPAGGSTSASLTVDFQVLGLDDIAIFRSYSATANISEIALDTGVFGVGGVYTIRGNIQLRASSLSGGPSARGDATVGVNLFPVPAAVPEPAGFSLLSLGIAGVLGAKWMLSAKAERHSAARNRVRE